jgi:hypothetical protein
MSKNDNEPSAITLRMYVDVLKKASIGQLEYIHDLPKPENRVARELLKSGLISDDCVDFNGQGPAIVSYATLTPEGASALESWSNYLKEESFFHKFGEALIRFLWVIVGALAASIPELLKAIAF